MKLRFLIPALVFGALFVVFALMLYRTDQGYNPTILESALIGKPLPKFRLPRVEEPTQFVDSESFKGRPFVLNVWATWCVECRHEHPVLLDLARENVVSIVGLDTKDELAGAQAWLQKLGNPYAATAFDGDGKVGFDLGVYGAPETFLVDAQGLIVYRHVGVLTREVWERDFLPRIKAGHAVGGGAGS